MLETVIKVPIVTVITPVFNGEKFLTETIESVLNQTLVNFEYIIVDDASTDQTFEIINKFKKKDKRIKIVKLNKNVGPITARNLAIDKSKGIFIAFIDADDLWHPEKLNIQIKEMQEFDLNFTYTNFEIFRNKNTNRRKKVVCPKKYYLSTLFSNSGIALSSVIYKRDYNNLIRFADGIPYTEFDLYFSLIALYEKGNLINKTLLSYRHHNNSLSLNRIKVLKTMYFIYRKKLKFSVFLSVIFISQISFNSIGRQIKRLIV